MAMSDLTKSFKDIFEERISSPFYGSLIVSWLIWNWEIPYVTFFVDGDKLNVNKIEYITTNCNNLWVLIALPLLSTTLILLGIPFISNGAFWVTLKFDNWRINKKNEVENKRMMSVEQSGRLRMEIKNSEERYATIINGKDEELDAQKKLVQEYLTKISGLQTDLSILQTQVLNKETEIKKVKEELFTVSEKANILNPIGSVKLQREIKKFLEKGNDSQSFETLINKMREGNLDDFPKLLLKEFLTQGLIEKFGEVYALTYKGAIFYNEILFQKHKKIQK